MKKDEMPDYWVEGRTKATKAESGGTGVVIYTHENGWKEKVTAYSLPSLRNHNPANLKYEVKRLSKEQRGKLVSHVREKFGALDIDKDGYVIFPDWLTGKRAAEKWWEDARRDNKTINEAADQFLGGDKPAVIEKRKKDLEDSTRGHTDKYGRPVNRKTHLSDLTEEEFITLRNYNNMQLEGWLGNLENVRIEWIPPSGDTRQAPRPTPQIPATKTLPPASPAKPHSSLEAPQPPDPLPYPAVGTMGPAEQTAQGSKLLFPDISQGLPAPFSGPLAHYTATSFSPPTENSSVSWLDALIRPNLLASPSPFNSLFSGSGNLPQASPQPSGQAKTKPEGPAGQVRKAPFYSLKDRLDFLGRVYRVAKPISEETGLSLPFILAHAAHEVDFGKKIKGNNLFNLKADEKWQGPTHTRANGAYRSYPSYEESMKDYLAYLQANPRFGKMFEPVTRASLGRLADAIHYAGFSDDPLLWFPRFPFVEGVAPPALPVEGATRAPFIAGKRPHDEAGPLAV